MELFDKLPDVNVPAAEYQRLLGYPRAWQLDGRARELADEARAWYARHGRPWIAIRRADRFQLDGETVAIEGEPFAAPPLATTLSAGEADGVALAAVSAGPEIEAAAQRAWRDEKPDEYFFLEVYGSAVVEHLVTLAGAHLCAWAESRDRAVLPHYSPGYPGWNIAEQARLLRLLSHSAGPSRQLPLAVLVSGMLRPKKSLLAVFGTTRRTEFARRVDRLVPCEACSLSACQYRRTPYLAPSQLGMSESLAVADGAALFTRFEERNSQAPAPTTYRVNHKALERWTRKRLTLAQLKDGSIDARFRYDGTTCNNMGRPFNYALRFSPPRERRILHRSCRPSAGDVGHRAMCQYVKEGESLLTAIDADAPPLGAPLAEIMAWPRTSSSAGCYCDSASRRHKWGLVLETVHYALVRGAPHGSGPQLARGANAS